MTTTFTTPVQTLGTPGPRLMIDWLKGLIARIGLATRLERLNDRQLRDAGLHRSDIDWLRCSGSAQDATTGLAIRAGMRVGNW